jgi:hypothetical protein
MAGSAGHIRSPWEDGELNFGEIKQLIKKSLCGELNATEKLDGQNIMVTFREDDIFIARTPSHLRNYGINSIKWNSIHDFMKTEEAKFSYMDAAAYLFVIFSKIGNSFCRKFFKEGKRWLNMELLTPAMENIISYGKMQLRVHNLIEVDVEGNTIDLINDGEFNILLKVINDIQRSSSFSGFKFKILRTNKVKFNSIIDVDTKYQNFLKDFEVLMSNNNLEEGDSINKYIANQLSKFIISNYVCDSKFMELLVQRWVYKDKSTNIIKLLKDKDEELILWVKNMDLEIENVIFNILQPIIILFMKIGILVLQNLDKISSSDPQKTIESIKSKSEDAINRLKEYKGKKLLYLNNQLELINQSGGLEGIAPVEGIVFEYNNKIYKLSGNYLPLLKIISFFRFGKDKE